MKKQSLFILILCFSGLLFSGCSIFNSEYEVVEDYISASQTDSAAVETVKVRNISSLKQAISTIITEGSSEGKIVFDPAYDGDPVADMSKACWQVRTQDALCAYCVEDISYELSKIVTYYEARLSIGYADYVEAVENIVELSFSTGIENVIRKAMDEGSTKVVMLVEHSSYSAEDVMKLVSDVYHQDPAVAPREPSVSVNMYSGSNMQRLYEVNMRYGMTSDELQSRKIALRIFVPFDGAELEGLDEAQRALIAYEYICANTTLDLSGLKNTVYDALIGRLAGSEGIALAYVELCRQLDVECMVVYGQHDWQSHSWNIIKADGLYYHVDAGLVEAREKQQGFMKTDEDFWSTYRWDMSSYPACMPLPEPNEELFSASEENFTPEIDVEDAGDTIVTEEPDMRDKEIVPTEPGTDMESDTEAETDNKGLMRLSEPENELLIPADAENEEK